VPRLIIVLDTPGIKQFVFGTDTLAEIRGASDLLDSLNRQQTEQHLRGLLTPDERLVSVYANGGSGQFLLDTTDPQRAEAILEPLAQHYREQTGGEARIVWGVAECPDPGSYQEAVGRAYQQLHQKRDSGSAVRAVPLLPFLRECDSSSHWPAREAITWGGERLLLSEVAQRKRSQSHRSRRVGMFASWIQSLFEGVDDNELETLTERLRCKDAEWIGHASLLRKGDIGMVYADGNAMGRLVRELDTPEATMAFSKVVDQSIRQACYQALNQVLQQEIATVQASLQGGGRLSPLPADILLLGGDDLLVLVPADRAIRFARTVADLFETETKQQIALLPAEAREFFHKRGLGVSCGPTISCGVAVAPARYPFYLLLDLAEELLKNAKRAGSRAPTGEGRTEYRAPARIDFHLVTGSNSQNLDLVRAEDYQVGMDSTNAARTRRPCSPGDLLRLEQQVRTLRSGEVVLPRSKRQALWEAALDPVRARAERRCREILCRLKPRLRNALLGALGISIADYPWTDNTKTSTALADLMEVWDLVELEDCT
jgi:hypothetical protein